jgi:acetyl-CoA acetyltransferase
VTRIWWHACNAQCRSRTERGGGTLAVGGRLPTNTAGGFLSFSHAGSCGIFSLIELVLQLRGEAGARQVEGAQLGYLHGVGGAMQMHFGAVLAKA